MTPQQGAADREIIFAMMMMMMLRDLQGRWAQRLADSDQFSREPAQGSGPPAEDTQAVGGRRETEARHDAPDTDDPLASSEARVMADGILRPKGS
jgi:hypothetical protein